MALNSQPRQTSGLIKLQPDYNHDGYGPIPYPFWIHPESGDVARQEFWKGSPAQLLGFTSGTDIFEVELTAAEYAQDPGRATGMFPVFVDEDSEIYTYTIPTRAPSA
ncbi:hypothetical protein ACTXL8_07250 [Glutamicibacter arilaitensis]|uniref:hypothetical protein n=1 Tax=Glutamicibacter arilaitensis TaxID=256701 RepID=UPI003FCF7FB8